MYVQQTVCENEESPCVEERTMSSVRVRTAVPWICTAGLLVAVFSGTSLWNRNETTAGIDSGIRLDLEESKIRIPLDIIGISYKKLSSTNPPGGIVAGDLCNPKANVGDSEQTLFQKAIQCSVSEQGKIPWDNVEIETDITSTNPNLPLMTPGRTELHVKVSVPAEISADALIHRLTDDGKLMKDMKANLLNHKIFKNEEVMVQFSTIEQSSTKKGVFETEITPMIVLEMDVRGINYDALARDPSLQTGFVDAVRSGIAHGHNLGAKSIALDIQNGGTNGGVPFVHVTSKFPVPSGMKADATMSQWPQGVSGIGSNVQTNVRNIANIATVSKDNTGVQHPVQVFPGTLHLGAVRETFQTKVRALVEVEGLTHTAGKVSPSSVKSKILELVKKDLGSDKEVEVVYWPLGKNEAFMQANDLNFQVQVSARGEEATKKALEWQNKLLPAVAAAKKYFQDENRADIPDLDLYKVMLEVPTVKQEVDTIDFDVVIHGIDYAHIPSGSKAAFLSDLAKAMREGVTGVAHPHAHLAIVKEHIQLTVSESARYTNAINVRIHIPAPATALDVGTLVSSLDANLETETKKNLLAEVKNMDGIKYVTSWTNDAIAVSIPSTIVQS